MKVKKKILLIVFLFIILLSSVNVFATEVKTLLRTYLGGTEFFENPDPKIHHYSLCNNCAYKLTQFLNNETIDD